MLESIFNTSVTTTLSIGTAVLTVSVAFVLGLIISATYMLTHRKGHYSQNFTLTAVMLPMIIAIVIMLVGSNIARAFSLAGAFSLVRFRSAPGDPKDIAYVFFAMAVGLACGAGYLAYGAMFTLILCIFMIILNRMDFGSKKTQEKQLRITIPENLDYQGAFDDLLEQYTQKYTLTRVKTADLGTLYELSYVICAKNDINEKEFIDALRCRNGNLNIILTLYEEHPDY